jgi:cobalt-zinc-cadmium efflux system protein
MGHGHDHADAVTATGRNRWRLQFVVVITATVFVAEVIGALVSNSLALLADAAHMLTDSLGLVLALVAASLAMRPATKRRTFGLQRAEVLAALANAVVLCVIGGSVLVGAVQRWNSPTEVAAGPMFWFAIVGMVANLVGILVLWSGRGESLNLRGAYLEVLADLLGSVAVIVAAVMIGFTGWAWLDSVAGIAIFTLIVPRVWSLLREALDVLLEATPPGIDLDEVRTHLLEADDVTGVHDLHAWTITSGSPVLSAHIVVSAGCLGEGRSGEVLDRLSNCLDEHFDLDHCTLQLEPEAHREHEHSVHD